MHCHRNSYDEYGVPAAGNAGRFQYTGRPWIAEAGLYDYRARMYNPRLGRFMQTDPIGYEAGMNIYAYVRNDPVNLVDPFGLQDCPVQPCNGPVVVTGGARPRTGHRVGIGNVTELSPREVAEDAAGGLVGCNPQPTNVYPTPAQVAAAAARATAIANDRSGNPHQEFHAEGHAVPGGYSFRMTGAGPVDGGRVGIALWFHSISSSHNHEASDSNDQYADYLSNPNTNTVGHIRLDDT